MSNLQPGNAKMHFEGGLDRGVWLCDPRFLSVEEDIVKCVAFLFVLYLMLSFCFVVLSCELLILVD